MNDKLLSLCIPCMNRTNELIAVMPTIAKAANASPPVEVSILDYNSEDGLHKFIHNHSLDELGFDLQQGGNQVTYRRVDGRPYYHMAHARNLSVLASHGEYAIISSCDIRLDLDFFSTIRTALESRPRWAYFRGEMGVVTIHRNEFIAAGGFDERFELYGSEDRDLFYRLQRRGAPYVEMPEKKFYAITTPDSVKSRNYRGRPSKFEMIAFNKMILEDNIQKGVLVANPEGWGAWT